MSRAGQRGSRAGEPPEARSVASDLFLSTGAEADRSGVSDEEFLRTVGAAMDAGAQGLAVGRNIWQRDNPLEMLDMLEQLIFEGTSVEEALAHGD